MTVATVGTVVTVVTVVTKKEISPKTVFTQKKTCFHQNLFFTKKTPITLQELQKAALRTLHRLSNVSMYQCSFQKYWKSIFFKVVTAVTVWRLVRKITQPLHKKNHATSKFFFLIKNFQSNLTHLTTNVMFSGQRFAILTTTLYFFLWKAVQLDILVVQKNHQLLKPPNVWCEISIQTWGGFRRWWFFCTTRWSYCTTGLIDSC